MFDIKSNDEGTWRRIRVVEFESKFVDKPSKDPKDKEFQKDKTLEDKFKSWAPIFASMLIRKVNETKGRVEDCDEVLGASKLYRENQDYLARFVSEKIKKFVFNPDNPERKNSRISKSNIINEFKEWWKREYDTKPPKALELTDYLNIRLGKYDKRSWKGYEIVHDDYQSDED